MSEALDQVRRLREAAGVAAMATLVAASGSTPKKAGAKMWVAPDGSILGSVTIGGCVDAQVVREAESVLAGAEAGEGARLLALSLGDEEAWEIGLTCGGAVEVVVERVDASAGDDPIVSAYEAAAAEVAAGRRAVVVSALDGSRARLVVGAAGILSGTLGNGGRDAAAASAAMDELGASFSTVRSVPVGGVDERFYFELHRPSETMVIYGAGQVAMSLVTFARELGMRTVIVDGRARYATPERFPAADEILVGMPSEIAERLGAGPGMYVVLVAHDYKYELPVLRRVLRSDVGYVGMLGSRRRGDTITGMLREEGFTDAEIARIHTPIGLAIGARSAPEIALAIAAEVVAVREAHGATRRPQGGERNAAGE